MKTSELIGAALDWAVAQCEGEEVSVIRGQLETRWTDNGWKPSTDWAQGGPIIERESISLSAELGGWDARIYEADAEPWCAIGPAPLIAAMRCYVASVLGDEVEIPATLLETV